MKLRNMLAAALAMVCILSAFSFTAFAAKAEILGDVNGDGKINVMDYGLLKKAVMGKAQLNDAQTARGDVNGNNKLDVLDYAFIKKHVMGTYTITGTVKPLTANQKIINAIGKRDKISMDFKTTLNGVNANATVSFQVVKGVLHLKGYAKAENGIVVDLDMPMTAINGEYSFSGNAEFSSANLEGSCTGTIVAATYSIDKTSFDKIEFTANIPLNTAYKTMFETNCKDAMNQFLYQANILLEQEKTGVNIGDLGFTNYLQEINDGWVEF